MGGSVEKMMYTNNKYIDQNEDIDCSFLKFIHVQGDEYIPYRLFPWFEGSNYIGIYYHGNDENIDII